MEERNEKHNSHKKFGFYKKYLALCRHRNVTPLPEIKKSKNSYTLDLFIDRVDTDNCIAIIDTLPNDLTLQTISIKLRKRSDFGKKKFHLITPPLHSWPANCENPKLYIPVLEEMTSLNKLRKFECQPVILSKYLFDGLTKALGQNIKTNVNLTKLTLEGFPLNSKYAQFLSEVFNFFLLNYLCYLPKLLIKIVQKGLSNNSTIQCISLERCFLGDEGCSMLCRTIKYLPSIEHINLSNCELTEKSAVAIADLVKVKVFKNVEVNI